MKQTKDGIYLLSKPPNKSECDQHAATFGEVPVLTTRGPTSLAAIKMEDCLLSLNEDYAVISKPADVRMDGEFTVTVEKLLLSWQLPPIQSSANIKWVHQLDYATSGCLCVALHRKSAAAASLAFAQRDVRKQYLALVYGHLDLGHWPLQEGAPECIEYGVPKTPSNKHASHKRTATWQDQARDDSFDACWDALQAEVQSAEAETDTAVLASLRELAERPRHEYLASAKLRKALRKVLRTRGVCPDVLESGKPAKRGLDSDSCEPIDTANIPKMQVFQVSSSSSSSVLRYVGNGPAGADEFLRIRIPVAEVDGDFRMEVGHAGRPGKAAETDMRVLSRTLYRGDPVTKVLLLPLTGRRHQLRVHCMAIGFPIVGDFTYASVGDTSSQERTGRAERMMLHAYTLEVPEPTDRGKVVKTCDEAECAVSHKQPPRVKAMLVQVIAPDPFCI